MKELIKYSALAFSISLFVLLYRASKIEDDDFNVIGLYMTVFFLPILLVSIVNAFILMRIRHTQFLKRVAISIIPIAMLAVLFFMKDLKMPGLGGDYSFITSTCIIGLVITNFIWNYKIKTTEANYR